MFLIEEGWKKLAGKADNPEEVRAIILDRSKNEAEANKFCMKASEMEIGDMYGAGDFALHCVEDTVEHLCFESVVIVAEYAFETVSAIHSMFLQCILDDWYGKREFVPEDDARVFFAAYNGKPISPYEYHDFKSLMMYLEDLR